VKSFSSSKKPGRPLDNPEAGARAVTLRTYVSATELDAIDAAAAHAGVARSVFVREAILAAMAAQNGGAR
jgi:uncharacterized protein (DUF1778 family)